MTLHEFQILFPKTNATIYQAIVDVCPAFDITDGPRLWMFLAQCGHESNGFSVFSENLNYSKDGLLKVFRKYFNEKTAEIYARNPQRIASRVYANRMGNGDEDSGDGWKYRGRGPIQLTGKFNIGEFSKDYLGDASILIDNPDKILEPNLLIASACWFWKVNKLNDLADAEDIVTVTKRINGGNIGLEERKSLYNKIKQLLS